ncbi:hypothetical protein DB346_23120 [Verrucomicrobia bacterium LW23]|nr:hypothetical protein DB346_23120 [Verrucomicrobia bacterium LW23]
MKSLHPTGVNSDCWRSVEEKLGLGIQVPWKDCCFRDSNFVKALRDGDDSAVSLFNRLIRHSHWQVRYAACKMLHALPNRAFFAAATVLADDRSQKVSRAARQISLRRTIQLSDSPSPYVRLNERLRDIEKTFGADAATATAQYAEDMTSQQIRVIVHDIRTILASIKRASAHFSKVVRPEHPLRRDVEAIKHDAEFLERLVRDMTEYSRPFRRLRSTSSCQALIHTAFRLAREAAVSRFPDTGRVNLILDIEKDVRLRASRSRLLISLTNIIQNAIESYEGIALEQEAIIRICFLDSESKLSINITDNGRGIDAEDLSEILAFVPGRSSKRGGTGYGLPIAYRNILADGGKLHISSDRNRGTVVILDILKE